MFRNSEINIDQVITPFRLAKSILNKKSGDIFYSICFETYSCLNMTSYDITCFINLKLKLTKLSPLSDLKYLDRKKK